MKSRILGAVALLVAALAIGASYPVGHFSSLIVDSRPAANISTKTVTLTDDQIKALPTTAVTVIPAPPATYRIVLIRSLLRITSTGHAYTNINAGGYAYLQYSGTNQLSNYIANDSTSSPALTDFTVLLNGADAKVWAAQLTRDAAGMSGAGLVVAGAVTPMHCATV